MEHPHSAQHCVLLCRVASKAGLPPVDALSVLQAGGAGMWGLWLRCCAVSRRSVAGIPHDAPGSSGRA